ncbi:MAG: TetR/AcrR family transcriptional regulator [Firmicutes bacterium]|nr:TetR/AcrR family transcriptional regulator [Bacillota bacterium]
MSLTKQKIIQTAVRLFNEKSFSATSVQDIADALNVTKAALYYYVSSKEEILYEIFDHAMTTAELRLKNLMGQKMPVEQLIHKIIYNQIMAFIDEMPNIAIFFSEKANLLPENLKAINIRERKYENKIASVLEEGIKKNIFKDNDILPTVYAIIGMCNWLYHWYKPDGRLKPEEIARLYSDIILNGILK